MARRVLLKKLVSSSAKRLVVIAEAVDDSMTEEIFKFLRKPANPLDETGILDLFITVCNPTDLEELPIDAPDDDSDNLYRAKRFDKTYLTAEEANDAWDELEEAVDDLLDELRANDRFEDELQVLVGDATSSPSRHHLVDSLLANRLTLAFGSDAVLQGTYTKVHGTDVILV